MHKQGALKLMDVNPAESTLQWCISITPKGHGHGQKSTAGTLDRHLFGPRHQTHNQVIGKSGVGGGRATRPSTESAKGLQDKLSEPRTLAKATRVRS